MNGEWEFGTDPVRQGLTERYFEGREFRGRITVPFAYQWAMSGLGDRAVEEVVWYTRDFEVPAEWIGEDSDLLLHFGAVDYQCTVWVNGKEVGHNTGGHVPFSLNIAPYVKAGVNRVYVRVDDPQSPYQPRGKQAVNAVSRSCDYYCTTGIWQTVWLEPVPSLRIEDVVVTCETEATHSESALNLRIMLHAPAIDLRIGVRVFDGSTEVATCEAKAINGLVNARLPLKDAKLWSPESPNLYDITLELKSNGDVLDTVRTYAGLRSIEVRERKIFLNGEPVYLKMVLDQGYWPESGMTAPSDEALRRDVEITKEMGFNGARKHQKVEDPRWLYWCDKLGLLVWSEMPNARAWSPAAEEMFIFEWERAVRRDMSHPCVIAWVPLNESWGVPALDTDHPGQFAFVERLVALTRRLDGTRPIIDNDGWEHSDVGDIFAIHDYTATGGELIARYKETLDGGPMITKGWGRHPREYFAKGAKYRGQPVILSEVGGFLSIPPDVDPEKLDHLYGAYGSSRSPEDLLTKYEDIMRAIGSLPFVSGFCYTQLTDVEQEINGLVDYHRNPKVPLSEIARIHRESFGS
ncbi:glycoside hydrolase family 2 sugar binding protein [Fimbriimonas ginsengisoli Gsoil 348]|uniref:Glycoside hydrolase family 2 sugar binding protein n=1 Tax=Fimbriimonas ginsengisoli Gsoil 348 TaxID=661478 RepID=A0A068NY22_FIMGI|nr:glycoside hydrolase family 2 sugar binding protein [Fimbriimonas ginsengisoli Gsoil 348]